MHHLALNLAIALALVAPASPARADGSDILKPDVVSLVVNGMQLADALIVHQHGRSFWLPTLQARGWRLDIAERARRTIEGVEHAEFCQGRDRCFYAEESALLTLTLAHRDLTVLEVGPQPPPKAQPADIEAAGGWLNYDLGLIRQRQNYVVAQLEGRVWTKAGEGALKLAALHGGGHSRRSALQALWQVDLPESGVSAQMGHALVPDTPLSSGLPLFGARLGSNAALQPGSSEMVRPRFEGEATRALRADVFVDGFFRQSIDVPYGPYGVTVQPPYPGRGTIEVLATDAAGNRQQTQLQFYATPALLEPGARVWSLDLGRLASETGRISAHAPMLAGGALRQGISPNLTLQGQALWSQPTARLGFAADHAAAAWGLSSASLQLQRDRDDTADPRGQTAGRSTLAFVGLGHEIQDRRWSLSAQAEHALGTCVRAPMVGAVGNRALIDRLIRPCTRAQATASAQVGHALSWSAAIATEQDRAGRRSAIGTLSGRWQVGARSSVSVLAQSLRLEGRSRTLVQISWNQALDSGHAMQSGISLREREKTRLQWGLQSMAGPDSQASDSRWQAYGSAGGGDNELGGRWLAGSDAFEWRAEGRASRQGAAHGGSTGASSGTSPGASYGTSGSASISGAIGWLGDRPFASRRIDNAFVVVDTGLPGLPVLMDNREVARTNAQGFAVVPQARAWQVNTIGVDTASLPIQYSMPRDQLEVTPRGRSAAVARFDVSDGGLLIAVRDAAGQPLPPGAVARVSTQSLPTAVTSRSEVFLERSDRAASIEISWAGQSCVLSYRPEGPNEYQRPEGRDVSQRPEGPNEPQRCIVR